MELPRLKSFVAFLNRQVCTCFTEVSIVRNRPSRKIQQLGQMLNVQLFVSQD